MALNEEKILSGNFIFLSYSHKDIDVVKQDAYSLIEKGVRVWFDENMRVGDNWVTIAERAINHENCVGVLFYTSASAFISKAVQREQELTRSRISSNPSFAYWSVNIDSKPMMKIKMEAMNLAVEKNDYDYEDVSISQAEMFNSRILYIPRNDSETCVNRIYDEIATPYRLVDNDDNVMDALYKNNIASKDTEEIIFGRYVDRLYTGPLNPQTSEDQRFGEDNKLIYLNGKRYNSKPLKWRLVKVVDDKVILLCTSIIATLPYFDANSLLANQFFNVAFSNEDKLKFVEGSKPRFMNSNDLIDCNNTDVLILCESEIDKHWWIDNEGLFEYWKQTYSGNIHYNKGFSVLTPKGVRPVIEIQATKL